jgi:hypothetical protein
MFFDRLAESIIQKFKPTQGETIAILPGGFKPPHKGHFNALNYILEEADKGIVYIGTAVRDNITPDQSKRIWEIYKKYLSKPIDVYISEKTPVVSTYDYAGANLDKNIIVGAGPEDEARFNFFKKHPEKYPLVKIVNIPSMHDRISGTAIRQKILKNDKSVVNDFTPTVKKNNQEMPLLSQKDRDNITSIIFS